MKFEEQFPNLKDKVVKDDGYGTGVNDSSGFISYIMIENVQKYCFDKQKTIEAIDNLQPKIVSQKFNRQSINDLRKTFAYYLALEDLKKELNNENLKSNIDDFNNKNVKYRTICKEMKYKEFELEE